MSEANFAQYDIPYWLSILSLQTTVRNTVEYRVKVENCNVSTETSVHGFCPIINTRNKLSLAYKRTLAESHAVEE